MKEHNHNSNEQQQQKQIKKPRSNNNVVVINLDTPIRPNKPWNILLLLFGIIMALHPIVWIICLHYSKNTSIEADRSNNTIANYIITLISTFILDWLPKIVSNVLTCLLGLFFLVNGIIHLRGEGIGQQQAQQQDLQKLKSS